MNAIAALRRVARYASQTNREISAAAHLAACRANSYDDLEVIRFRVARAELHHDDDGYLTKGNGGVLALLAVASMSAPARVFDFGGGFGHYGHILKASLPPRTLETYCVGEHPAFVERASAAGFDCFVTSAKDVRANVVFSSGTLQYMESPMKTLSDLIDLDAEYLVLARNFFSTGPVRFFEQRASLFDHGAGPIPDGFENRPTMLYPQAMSFAEVIARLKPTHELIMQSDNSDAVVYRADGLFGSDLIFRRRRAQPVSAP